jgi:type II restriction/modification system DNA methylase subunit YeeA
METSKLKKFAQFARRSLIEQVSGKLQQVLAEDSAARREEPKAVEELVTQIKDHGRDQVIEKVAYAWFNRFCALRFMDVNRYTRIGVVSPAEGQLQPEILAEAKMGHIDEDMVPEKTRQKIFALLNGTTLSRDPQAEAYRLLVVATCNDYHKAMDYLFEKIADYTELLMPDDLLSGNSILAYTRDAMTPDACQDVEVIGWLYQFYISEKKDEVFEGLKKNRKITPENIPAATQLFTPHWIVRYLVENSLGRIWMLNRPNSRLAEKMAYYIKPETPETDFLKISKPEEIKVCDPACGSGHMLVYSFDILYFIYEEEGYEATEIPRLILENNLFGIEIDKRAGELAAFALTMKARARQRRFFNKGVRPNICVLENVRFDEDELNNYTDFVGRDLFTAPLEIMLRQFEEADNFGSLIRPHVTDVGGLIQTLEAKGVSGQLFLNRTHKKVLQVLRQADYLSPKYHVVIANPPYMGGKGMNVRLGVWVKENFPRAKPDLMTCFMERAQELVQSNSYWGMINLPSWMFLGSFESLRLSLITKNDIQSMLHLGRGIFGSDFGSVAFVIKNSRPNNDAKGIYRRLFDKFSLVRTPDEIESLFLCKDFGLHEFLQANFRTIPGQPIAYWLSESFINAFRVGIPMQNYAVPRQGFSTGKNDRFLRCWQEVSINEFNRSAQNSNEANDSGKKWFPCNKGGEFRKWYGNNSIVANWQHDGAEMRAFPGSVIRNPQYYFREGITWSTVTIASLSMRYSHPGFVFETKGSVCFPLNNKKTQIPLALMNTRVVEKVLLAISPTLDFHEGPIGRVPVIEASVSRVTEIADRAVAHTKFDWDSYETSWDFTNLPLLNPDYRQPTLKETYQKLRAHWHEMTLEMHRLEEENNRIFIEAYGLQDELPPDVPLNEITLTCNLHYRYGKDKSEEELEALLLADTMRELVSYSVGCMFGRYALNKPGLILANQGETIEDYHRKLKEPQMNTDEHRCQDNEKNICVNPCESVVQFSFEPDTDNVLPMLDGDWFTDDISERFKQFLKIAFGPEHYEENLRFVENALGKDIRKYFLKDFYNDHLKRYKKRPIYWLFSSPRGSFNALIYMHRYRPDTVSVVLNDYLREFRTKLFSRKNHLEAVSISANASQGEKTKALKEIENLKKMINELDAYEREVMYPLATQQLVIDLDDGVKVNYLKFGAALKKIVGLDLKEE